MSKRLMAKIDLMFTKVGAIEGRTQLCLAIRKSERTLLRWLKEGPPTAHDAYTLAKGAGCTDEEALALAGECFPGADGTNKRRAS